MTLYMDQNPYTAFFCALHHEAALPITCPFRSGREKKGRNTGVQKKAGENPAEIRNLLKPEAVFCGVPVPGGNKNSAIREISRLCAKLGGQQENTLYGAFLIREKIESTGFGGGIAIPHAKLANLEKPLVAAARFAGPVEWDSIDGEPVRLAIILVMPEHDAQNTHLKVLSRLSRRLADSSFAARLAREEDPALLYRYLLEGMEEKDI